MSLFRNNTKRHQAPIDREVCELRTSGTVTMEDFQCEVMRALWHPFEFLNDGETGTVQVSRLKVITSSIGQRLGHKKAEEFLDKDGVTSMTFDDFFQVIKEELLDKAQITQLKEDNKSTPSHPSTTKTPTIHELIHGIVKTCWTFCRFERNNRATGMTMDHCMILWRLFNFLSECDSNRKPNVPIRLHREEVALLLREFIDYTGQRNKESVVKEFTEHRAESDVLSFTEFLNLFEKDFADSLSRNDISQGLNHLFDYYIMNVLAREMMWKRGYNVKHWKERWLVLTTSDLKYYVNSTEKAQKGLIVLDSDCSVEVPPDRPTNRANRFVINTKKKPYEISAPDAKTKHEWVSAIQTALKCVDGNPNIQKETAFQRCLERINRKRLAEEEERKRLEEAENLRKQQEELDEAKRKRLEDEELLKARQNELDEERKRRAEMEDKLLEEQRLREEEQQRLRELEAIKLELERLLNEERQAKKDEEIVRNLQARLLEEEFQKREELEKLKQQQDEMLRAEREQKAVLEVDRKEQQRILQDAKERLEQLERERAAAAAKMQEASEKLLKAEKDRHIIEERVKLFKTKTSGGLNRPVQPRIDPLVTHRGHGAFCHRDFVKIKEDKGEHSGDSGEHTEHNSETVLQNQNNISKEEQDADHNLSNLTDIGSKTQLEKDNIEQTDTMKEDRQDAKVEMITKNMFEQIGKDDKDANHIEFDEQIDETKIPPHSLDTETEPDHTLEKNDADDDNSAQSKSDNEVDDNEWTNRYLIPDIEETENQQGTIINVKLDDTDVEVDEMTKLKNIKNEL